MTLVAFFMIYAGVLVFLVACGARAVGYARMPPHLRWELYPVPHEEPERVRHGGSYFEEREWWTRPRRRHLAGDLRFMIPEMIFLKGLWQWNRSLWYRSFPFHFGLYLMAAATGLVVATAIVMTAIPASAPILIASGVPAVYRTAGATGCLLAIAGAAALLHRRVADPALRIYSAPADAFNLVFFIVTLAVLLAGYATAGVDFVGVLGLATALLRFDVSVEIPRLVLAGLVLSSVLVAYIPLTHMSHFIAKYFTYHAVRWDDRPNVAGGRIEHRIAACLAMRPTWSAGHLGADGTRTWIEIALGNAAGDGKR